MTTRHPSSSPLEPKSVKQLATPPLSLDVTTALDRSAIASRRSSLDLDSASTAAPSIIDHKPCGDSKSSSCSSVTLAGSPPPTRPSSPSNDRPRHSTAKLLLIHFALGLALFLATTDVHLVATSLPTIASDLQGPQALYTWVGVAYILPQTILQPLWGKTADIIGRKPVLYSSLLLFLVGSVLCGVAKSMLWLVIARAVSGAGAGGLVPMVWIITGEIVPIAERAKWSDMLTFVWAASALAGPLLGGVFSESVSWRWGFFVNVPVSIIAAVLLFIFLRDELPGADERPWREQLFDLNYPGLALLVSGTTAVLLGFSEASTFGWNNPVTIVLLILGFIGLMAGCVQETYTKKTRFVPAGIFGKTGAILSVGSFVQTFCFTAATYYLALFFQAVSGASAIEAGIRLLPFSLGSALISLVANFYIKRMGDPKTMVIIGLGIAAVGFGLLIRLNERSSLFMELFFPLVAGLGMGLLFRSPFAAMEKTLPEKDRAPMTACFFLVRFIGTSVGLAAAGAVFDTRVQKTMPFGYSIDTSSVDWRSLVQIPDPELRSQVLASVSGAVSLIWVLCTPLLAVSCLLSFLIDTDRRASDKTDITSRIDDLEKGRGICESLSEKMLDKDLESTGAASTVASTTTLPLSTSTTLEAGSIVDGKVDISMASTTSSSEEVDLASTKTWA